jgi:methylated-DNA-[protein]-cysteine S-methyltransferase
LEIFSTKEHLYKISFTEFTVIQKDDLSPLEKEIHNQIEAYFSHKLEKFSLPLKPEGSVFQNQIWAELLNIPFGQTRSYLDIALACHNEKSVRAVGNANSKNPIPIIIPCHRVIGTNGQLTGYAGGLERKKYLLENEGVYNQINLFA